MDKKFKITGFAIWYQSHPETSSPGYQMDTNGHYPKLFKTPDNKAVQVILKHFPNNASVLPVTIHVEG